MKKILTILFSVLSVSLMAQKPVQTIGNKNNIVKVNGVLAVDSAIIFAKDTIQLPDTARAISFKGNTIYVWRGSRWDSLSKITNAANPLSNGLLSTGAITLVDSTLTINDTIKWSYNGVTYTKLTPSVFTIHTADSGYYRRDLIYADTSGNLFKLVGDENASSAVPKALPPNSVTVTIVDIYGAHITPPTGNVIGTIPNWQQTMLQGDSTTEQVIVNNASQSPLQLYQDNNRAGYLYFKNTNSGGWAGTGFRFNNDVASSPYDEHSGHFLQLYMGSTNNDLVKDGGIVRSNAPGGLTLSVDSARLRFMKGFPYSDKPWTEMGAFEANNKLTLKFVDSGTVNSNNIAYFDNDTLKRGNLPVLDTTGKWVNNVYQRNDSLFKYQNGEETFIQKFSAGSVTSVSGNTPITITGTATDPIVNADTSNAITGLTTNYQNSLNQKKTDSVNVSLLNGGKIDTSHIPVKGFYFNHPLYAIDDSTAGLRNDSMPSLVYATYDSTAYTSKTLIPKQYLDDRISAVTASGITRTELQDTAAAIRSSIPAQFNPIAGTNVTLSGTYPNITFNASGGGGGGVDTLYKTNKEDSIHYTTASGNRSVYLPYTADSVVMVYPGQRLQDRLNLVPEYGTLRFAPGYFVVPIDTLGAAMVVTRSNLTIDIPAGTYIKMADSTNVRIDSVEINRFYAPQLGLNDLSAQSIISPPKDTISLFVIISSVGTPDKFTVKTTSGTLLNGPTNMTGGWQTISDSLQIKFNATTGHSLNDYWTLCTSSTPVTFLNIGQGFQTDTIFNTKIIGGGTIDDNAQGNYPVNGNSAQDNYTIGIIGRVDNTSISGITLINGERSILVAGRTSGTINNNGTVTGGTNYNVNGVDIQNVKSYNTAGFLLGHPSYSGYEYNVNVNNNIAVSTNGVAIEPNQFLEHFNISNNVLRSNSIALHVWRSPAYGNISDNTISGTIVDSAPSQWYRTSSFDVSFKGDTSVGVFTTQPKWPLDVRGLIGGGTYGGTAYGVTMDLSNGGNISRDAVLFNLIHGGQTFGIQGASVLGTNDLFFQGTPNSSLSNFIFESYNGKSLTFSTAGYSQPIIFAPGRVEKWRVSSTGYLSNTGADGTSAFQTSSFATAIVSKSGNYTATISDNTILVTATGVTITLPTAVGISGREYLIKLTASGTGTVATTSSQTIDGSTTYSLSAQYKYVKVKSDGANWQIIGNN